MPGVKTNERPGTRSQVRYVRISAYKAREVLDLVRGLDVQRADEVLRFSERDAAQVIRKCLASAVANAEHNDGQTADELYVSACFADEGPTLKRWRPRARGRATRIRKRTCHITVIVSRLPDEALERRRVAEASSGRAGRRAQQSAESRRRRVAKSRGAEAAPAAAEAAVELDEGPEALAGEATSGEATSGEATSGEQPEATAAAGADDSPDTEDEAPATEGDDDTKGKA
ncbi:MAG: 50S ribosomal protein L22 [Acidimicrobiales bacterium]|nr:50S ribosomal protein L22 [Acidimicrobiales bacterium]